MFEATAPSAQKKKKEKTKKKEKKKHNSQCTSLTTAIGGLLLSGENHFPYRHDVTVGVSGTSAFPCHVAVQACLESTVAHAGAAVFSTPGRAGRVDRKQNRPGSNFASMTETERPRCCSLRLGTLRAVPVVTRVCSRVLRPDQLAIRQPADHLSLKRHALPALAPCFVTAGPVAYTRHAGTHGVPHAGRGRSHVGRPVALASAVGSSRLEGVSTLSARIHRSTRYYPPARKSTSAAPSHSAGVTEHGPSLKRPQHGRARGRCSQGTPGEPSSTAGHWHQQASRPSASCQ